MSTIPIIRLEIESMRHAVCVALSEHAAQLDADIKFAVDSYCTPENIKRVVRDAVNKVLEKTIREEVERFFSYSGEGRAVIASAIKERILNLDLLNEG